MADDPLAQVLAKTAADPVHKPELARTLLASTVFVMGHIEGEDPAKRSNVTLNTSSTVVLKSHRTPEGKTIVPFFSSLEKLNGFIEGEEKYLAIPAMTLFELSRGSSLVLNAGHPIRVELTPDDIAKLMAQGMAAQNPRR